MLKNPIIYSKQIADRCIYGGASFVHDLYYINGYVDVYQPPVDAPISNRKLQGLRKYGKYRKYYQQNPVAFLHDFFNIQLLDSQAYLLMSIWKAERAVLCCSRAFGKSFLCVLFIMAKQMLSCNPWNCAICAGSSAQSIGTFKKLEDVANDRITSLMNSSGKVFKNEVVVNQANTDGFNHNPQGYRYKLYNGSQTISLNLSEDRQRGRRQNCVILDECGFLPQSLIVTYSAFVALDRDFKTGVSDDGKTFDPVELYTLPREVPNQIVAVSSASSTDTEFYRMYREYSKYMIEGDDRYFVADIDCQLVMKPTIANKPVKSALTREQIEASMKTNPQKSRREFYNTFTTEATQGAIIKRASITRNEEVRLPQLHGDGKKKYILAWDPARTNDNSTCLVVELYDDSEDGEKPDYKGRIVNSVNFIDIGKHKKSQMQIPDQIKEFRQMIVDYNAGAPNYGNIVAIGIDSGSGGGGYQIADFLMNDFVAADGETYPGLIDEDVSKEYIGRFPNAVKGKLHLLSPTKYKSQMFESMIEMVNQDKIKFTATYSGDDYLMIPKVDSAELKKERKKIYDKYKNRNIDKKKLDTLVEKELTKKQVDNFDTVKLDWRESLALATIDLLKEETVNMVRIKHSTGKDGFELTPQKRNSYHDDHCYTLAISSFFVFQERRKLIMNRKPQTSPDELINMLTIRRGKYNGKKI